MNWTPLFSEITESSVWDEPKHVRLAWITFLAKKDYVSHTYETNQYLLAKAANITVEEAEDAIRVLMAPDKRSRSQANEGRRIELVEGNLYRILSGERYVDKMRQAKKREADKQRMREKRGKATEATVAKTEEPTSEWGIQYGIELPESLRTPGCIGAVRIWMKHKQEQGEPYGPTSLKVALAKWADEFEPQELSLAIRESIANNWKGVFKSEPRMAAPERDASIPNLG